MRRGRILRATVACVVAAALAPLLAVPAGAHYYGDVDEYTHPFARPIVWLTERQVIEGYPDGKFRPLGEVTRQELAAFVHRYAESPAVPPGAPQFPDVRSSNPFRRAIRWMAADGLVEGYPDGTFRPVQAVTRQELAAVLHRFAGSPDPQGGEPSFVDVPPGHPFADAIGWLVSERIAEGYAGNRFRPRAIVTRQELAAFLYRYTGRDDVTGTIERVSLRGAATQSDEDSEEPDLSGDGRWVAFSTSASLHPDDTNAHRDVYVRDTLTDATTYVSVGVGPTSLMEGARAPSVSHDGRHVAFQSASDFLPADANGSDDVFVRDLVTGTTELVSAGPSGFTVQAESTMPAISADGRYVVFASEGADLLSDEPSGSALHVYVHDLEEGSTTRITDGVELSWIDGIDVAGDGGIVAYCAADVGLVVHELGTGQVAVPTSDCDADSFALSGDGSTLAYLSWESGMPVEADVIVRDLETGDEQVGSIDQWGGEPESDHWTDNEPYAPALSADGRYLAFVASGRWTWDNISESESEVYRRDLVAGTTTMVSRSLGAYDDAGVDEPVVSADGRRVAFSSTSEHLVPGDSNGVGDVFLWTIDD